MQKPAAGTRLLESSLIMSTATALSPEILAKYQPVIGLEVHVQLLTATKAFCGCVNQYGGEPNTHVCPTCLGLPGALPVLNRKAVEFAVLAAKAHQLRDPRDQRLRAQELLLPRLCPRATRSRSSTSPSPSMAGSTFPTPSGNPKRIGITRLHMEEDAGKSVHDGFADSVSTHLHRPEPLRHAAGRDRQRARPAHRRRGLRVPHALKEILLYTGVSDCNMEEGSLRCDANVSVMLKGAKAVRHQGRGQERQQLPLHSRRGGVRDRAPDRRASKTAAASCRSRASGTTPRAAPTPCARKEQAHDYRYFPEPDLPPLVVGAEWQAEILKTLPELPEARRARMIAEYEISDAGCRHPHRHARLRRPASKRRRRRRRAPSASPPC